LIEIVGQNDTREYVAAMAIVNAIKKLWPGIDTSAEEDDHVMVAANVKISGYKVGDIDIVVAGRLARNRNFLPRRLLRDMDGNRVINRPVRVRNFVVAIEAKDHSADSVRISGENIDVKYSRGGPVKWKSATEQNIAQVHSLKAYLEDHGITPFVHKLVLMMGLDKKPVDGALTATFDGKDFFAELAATSRLRKSGNSYLLSSGNDEDIERVLYLPIFSEVIPSALDRKRMDRIAARASDANKLMDVVGSQMIQLRGQGGTGKTVMLLQMAWRRYRKLGKRTLVLTYNHALAADIIRLLSLLGVPSGSEQGGIAVETVMSFMYTWFSRLHLLDEHETDFSNYDNLCRTAFEMLEKGAIHREDIQAVMDNDPDLFDFDGIVVDEAQDWPDYEVELLKALYGPTRLCLGDGIDQLVRGKRVRWDRGVAEDQRLVYPLSRCLRMKRNLALFANAVADGAGLNMDLIPSDEAAGGRIIVLVGSYNEYPMLHNLLLNHAREKGNAEIDFLFCVPSSAIVNGVTGRESRMGQGLRSRGFQVWDGVDPLVRKDFPRGKDAYRIVHYASCRGLEGWVVVLDALDELWLERLEDCRRHSLEEGENRTCEEIEENAEREAWRWIMMPLTRPIDTVVITLSDIEAPLSKQILSLAKKYPDLVEVYSDDTQL
jgi:hypothetical protein